MHTFKLPGADLTEFQAKVATLCLAHVAILVESDTRAPLCVN